MTRLPSNRAVWLALSLALYASLCLGGCGRDPVAPMSAAYVDETTPAVAATASPRLFAVPETLAPLPRPEPVHNTVAPQSVQAQYSQTAGPPPASKTQERPAPSPMSIYAPQPEVQQAAAPLPARQQLTQRASPAPNEHSAAGQQVQAMTQRATTMAQKGMLFAAKDELVQAIQLVAQSRDAEQVTTWHAKALTAGLTALKEADDFSPIGGCDQGLRVNEIARGHRTTILQTARDISPVVARQYYLGYAQQQLGLAVAGQPAASQALYVLGKVQMALAGPASETQALHGPRAMVYFQAALAVDPRNYQAANELGVLLAQCGQLAEAKRALLHSVTIQPHVEGWHNLAAVHRGLGESKLAELAENERQKLAVKGQGSIAAGDEKMATWVDPRTFAASGHSEPGGTTLASRSEITTPSLNQRR